MNPVGEVSLRALSQSLIGLDKAKSGAIVVMLVMAIVGGSTLIETDGGEDDAVYDTTWVRCEGCGRVDDTNTAPGARLLSIPSGAKTTITH